MGYMYILYILFKLWHSKCIFYYNETQNEKRKYKYKIFTFVFEYFIYLFPPIFQ